MILAHALAEQELALALVAEGGEKWVDSEEEVLEADYRTQSEEEEDASAASASAPCDANAVFVAAHCDANAAFVAAFAAASEENARASGSASAGAGAGALERCRILRHLRCKWWVRFFFHFHRNFAVEPFL
jgi:hypothetical protein